MEPCDSTAFTCSASQAPLHRMQEFFLIALTISVIAVQLDTALQFLCLYNNAPCANAVLKSSATHSTTLQIGTAPGTARPLQWILHRKQNPLLHSKSLTAWLTLYQEYRSAAALQIGLLCFRGTCIHKSFAWQCCSFCLRSDMRWYRKALPMWTQAQKRILELPEEETAESEGTVRRP